MAIDFINSVNGTTGTAATQTSKFEMAILASQSEKVNVLEELLTNQMLAFQGKNDQLAALNAIKADILAKKDSMPGEYIFVSVYDQIQLSGAMQAAGTSLEALFGYTFSTVYWTRPQVDTAVARINVIIENSANTQQMDLLRVQLLSGKRNEAVEMLTVLIKKFADSMNDVLRKTN